MINSPNISGDCLLKQALLICKEEYTVLIRCLLRRMSLSISIWNRSISKALTMKAISNDEPPLGVVVGYEMKPLLHNLNY